MFHKLLLITVTAAGLAIPLAFTSPAQADIFVVTTPVPVVVQRHSYRVYYRASPWSPWMYYGKYRHFHHAENAAFFLRAQGFAVRIR